jgi:hypothetical protein
MWKSMRGEVWMALWCFWCGRKTAHVEIERGWRCAEWCGEEMRMR